MYKKYNKVKVVKTENVRHFDLYVQASITNIYQPVLTLLPSTLFLVWLLCDSNWLFIMQRVLLLLNCALQSRWHSWLLCSDGVIPTEHVVCVSITYIA